MIKARLGIFETNSSATHAFSIVFGDGHCITSYSENEDQDDIYLDESDIDDILRCIPTERLLEELKNRNSNDTDKT